MTEEQIAAAKQRASDTVNGFKKVRDQIARDALALVEELDVKKREISELKRKLCALELQIAGKSGKKEGGKFSSVFDEIFPK